MTYEWKVAAFLEDDPDGTHIGEHSVWRSEGSAASVAETLNTNPEAFGIAKDGYGTFLLQGGRAWLGSDVRRETIGLGGSPRKIVFKAIPLNQKPLFAPSIEAQHD